MTSLADLRALVVDAVGSGDTDKHFQAIMAISPEVVLALLDVAEAGLADYGYMDTDGETGDRWCHWCEALEGLGHVEWCPWPKATSARAHLHAALEPTD